MKPAPRHQPHAVSPEDLDPDVRAAYGRFWTLPDGRLCGLKRFMMGWAVYVDLICDSFAEAYIFETQAAAEDTMRTWDGNGRLTNGSIISSPCTLLRQLQL